MKRRDVMRLGLASAALGLSPMLAGRAVAQQKLVLKASDVHPAGYPTVEAIEHMGKKLETATGGRLSVQMYASMQLGGEKEAIEQAQVGALQLARVSVGALGPVVDDLNVFNLPFLFRNTAHMQKVLDGEIGQELLDKVSNNPNTRLTLSSRSFMSFCESDPAFPRTRFLSTARIWSQTAFESTPPDGTLIRIGGASFCFVVRGTTTTVLR